MKNFIFAFSFFICFLASTQASYLRVINAVPGTQVLDVYYNVPNSNEKIRLFQDLNSTDIPPYFFVTVPEGNSTVTLTFMFKESANFSAPQATPQELEGMPTYDASMRAGNFSYTLIVASSASQNNSSDNMDDNTSSDSQNSTNDSQNNNSQYEFLLLNDKSQGDEPPSGTQVIRLVNVAPQADSISLITFDSQCPQPTGNNSQSGNDSESFGDEGSSAENSTNVSGNQTQSPALITELPYLQSSDYVQLPQGVTPQDLIVCYQGNMIPVIPVTLLNKDAKQFSILLFTGNQNQMGNETFENENQTSSEGSGNQTQGNDNQNESQAQGDNFVATLTDDEPDTTQNIRVRIIHAASEIPAVSILFDGKTIFSDVNFGNVTQYTMTVRGIHNITAIPASGSQQENSSQSSSSNISLPIIAFFSWRNTYTVAIVPTGMSMESNQSSLPEESFNSTDNFNETSSMNSSESESQTDMMMTPGFRGPYHQILQDQVNENASLSQIFAYIQVVHLAPNVSAVDVSIGSYNVSNLQFLSSTHYINVTTTESTNITITEAGNTDSNPIAEVSQNLQANTLYTLWIIESENGNPMVFVTTDRKVKIVCVMDDASDDSSM